MERLSEEERDFAARVGALIAGERLARDMTQEELAEATGVSVSTIGRWEGGKNAPKTYQAGRVIEALGIDRASGGRAGHRRPFGPGLHPRSWDRCMAR